MRFWLSLIFLAFALVTAACERSFESPPPVPPQVVIDQVLPNKAYAGQVVTLIGQEFDPEAAKNEVYFGTELAEVVGAVWRDPDGPNPESDHLAVVVPMLAEPGTVDLRVATDVSSATLENSFHFIGAGHPRDEKLDTILDTRYAPAAIATMPQSPYPVYGILGEDAWLLSLVFPGSEMRMDLGTCDRPVACAMTAVAWDTRPDPQNPLIARDHPNLHTFVTTVQLPDAEQSQVVFRLMRWRLDFSQDPVDFHVPDFIFEDESDFSPGRLFSLPRLVSDPDLHDLLVANTEKPQALLLRPQADPNSNPEHYALVNFDVDDDNNAAPQLLQDAVYAPFHGQVFASISNEPGIQVFEPEDPDGQGSPEIPATRNTLAIPNIINPDNPTLLQFGLLAWCNNSNTLYAQVAGTGIIFELSFVDNKLAFVPTEDPVGLRFFTANGMPFSMTCAKDGVSSERLYLATSSGIEVFSTGDPLQQVANIPSPNSRGGPQSLVGLRPGLRDKMVFADTARDRLLSFDAGNEIGSIQEDPIGSIFPALATSTDEALIYYGDTFANVIRVIDRFSGVLQRQFAIDATWGFGINQLSTLEGPEGDKLFAPLALNAGDNPNRLRYESLAVWTLDTDDETTQNSDHCRESFVGEEIQPDTVAVDTFHGMQLCRSRNQSRLFFFRHGEAPLTGRLWYQELDLQQEDSQQVFGPEQNIDIPINNSVDLLAIDRQGQIVAVLEDIPEALAEPSYPKWVRFVDIDNPNPDLRIKIDGGVAAAVGHMATLRLDALPWDAESEIQYIALLSVPDLGQVQVLGIQPDGTVSRQTVQTGGMPYSIFISPDERRAYVTHLTDGKVSVIELCCDRDPGCVAVTQTIAVEQWPYEVKFNNAGDTAYLTHLFSSRVSIIE